MKKTIFLFVCILFFPLLSFSVDYYEESSTATATYVVESMNAIETNFANNPATENLNMNTYSISNIGNISLTTVTATGASILPKITITSMTATETEPYIWISTGVDFGNCPIIRIDWANSDDGAGSGLDADLLDGQTGTYYTDGENIQNDTIDDDSIDFADVTMADLTDDINNTVDTEWDTVSEIEAVIGYDLMTSTEIDTISELEVLVGQDIIISTEAANVYLTKSSATATYLEPAVADSIYVNVTGDTMSGNLNMGACQIINVDIIYGQTNEDLMLRAASLVSSDIYIEAAGQIELRADYGNNDYIVLIGEDGDVNMPRDLSVDGGDIDLGNTGRKISDDSSNYRLNSSTSFYAPAFYGDGSNLTGVGGGTVYLSVSFDIPCNAYVTNGLVYWQTPAYDIIIDSITINYTVDGTDSNGTDGYDIKASTGTDLAFYSIMTATTTLQIISDDYVSTGQTTLSDYSIPAFSALRIDCLMIAATTPGGDPICVNITYHKP